MSYYQEQYSDQLLIKNQIAQAELQELAFRVKAYESMLSQAQVNAVNEEVRIRQLLQAYPPTVPAAREALEQLHEDEHEPTCECTLRAQHESALASI